MNLIANPECLKPDRSPDRELALDHLLLRLRPINRALKLAAEGRAVVGAKLMRPDARQNSITEQHVQQLFAETDRLAEAACPLPFDLEPTAEESHREEQLRDRARSQGWMLPLDAMAHQLGLSPFETNAVLVCAAPQLCSAYHRIYAYVHDDLNRLAPSLELIVGLSSSCLIEQLANREKMAPHGLLCRLGILHADNEPANPLHREYSLDTAAFDALTRRGAEWRDRFRDADLVETESALPLDVFPDRVGLLDIARLLRAPGLCVIGLWGRPHHGGSEAASALAAAAGRMLRRLPVGSVDEPRISGFLRSAESLDSLVWVNADSLPPDEGAAQLAARLAGRAVTIIVTGSEPWRPLELLRRRSFIDITLQAPNRVERQNLWQAVATDVDPRSCQMLADRYQFSPGAMRAAVAAAELHCRMTRSGASAVSADTLERACRTVSLRQVSQFVRTVMPRRQPEELILPANLHQRVVEIAAFYRSHAQVDESWGFGRLLSGGGIKVLMTGDSGTGKTAAAEVIAGQIDRDQPMLKVHLASVVSKWVGETEKNLDAVFQHAEESHAVLFFDEADSLFAKRGEIDKGSDRYANLEVGFLLQRLEDFGGLVILASNHKDQIDEAFMRRFQVVLHFPRPMPSERLRLWRMALPSQAPIDNDIDFEMLQKLDLTGAGIVNSARTAALLAAQEDASIGMVHLIPAITRQFQHEARLLPIQQLGRYAVLAGSPT
jgi:hypothetical protein